MSALVSVLCVWHLFYKTQVEVFLVRDLFLAERAIK